MDPWSLPIVSLICHWNKRTKRTPAPTQQKLGRAQARAPGRLSMLGHRARGCCSSSRPAWRALHAALLACCFLAAAAQDVVTSTEVMPGGGANTSSLPLILSASRAPDAEAEAGRDILVRATVRAALGRVQAVEVVYRWAATTATPGAGAGAQADIISVGL
jgi:hypothetical protein